MFTARPDIHGAIFDGQAEGAYANGSRVVKVESEPGDATPDGTGGKVLGSYSNPDLFHGLIAYSIMWDNRPGYAVNTTALKVAPEIK